MGAVREAGKGELSYGFTSDTMLHGVFITLYHTKSVYKEGRPVSTATIALLHYTDCMIVAYSITEI